MSEDIRSEDGDEARRIRLKTAHALRSQFNYEVGLKRIDHKLDVIEPAVKDVVKMLAQVGEPAELKIGDVEL